MSRVSGRVYEVPEDCRVVDARYLAPSIPARTAAPFEVDDDARVITVNGLVALEESPSQFVVVGSGKTATDAVVWLLGQGVDPGAVCWVRPRDPWMLNRAVVQPAPAVFLGMVADTLEAAGTAESLDRLFLGLEERGSMLRSDPSVTPTMGKAPTLATWELERLRTIEDVVRRAHLRRVRPGHLDLDEGSVAVARDAGRRALRSLGSALPAPGADLGACRHHAAADPQWLPVLRCPARRLRRGDPGRRRRQERALPAHSLQ